LPGHAGAITFSSGSRARDTQADCSYLSSTPGGLPTQHAAGKTLCRHPAGVDPRAITVQEISTPAAPPHAGGGQDWPDRAAARTTPDGCHTWRDPSACLRSIAQHTPDPYTDGPRQGASSSALWAVARPTGRALPAWRSAVVYRNGSRRDWDTGCTWCCPPWGPIGEADAPTGRTI
jgi:hypothetical protein